MEKVLAAWLIASPSGPGLAPPIYPPNRRSADGRDKPRPSQPIPPGPATERTCLNLHVMYLCITKPSTVPEAQAMVTLLTDRPAQGKCLREDAACRNSSAP